MLPDWVRADGALVDVKITLDAVGRIAEARVMDVYRKVVQRADHDSGSSGPDAFTDAAVAAVRQWRFDPPLSSVDVRRHAATRTSCTRYGIPRQGIRTGGGRRSTSRGWQREVASENQRRAPGIPPAARRREGDRRVIIETRIGTDGAVSPHVLKSSPCSTKRHLPP